jgi:hypothetical protein
VVSRRHGLVALVAGLGLVGCGSFEDPAIVLDLRVLAMRAEPPEQLFPVDPAQPGGQPARDRPGPDRGVRAGGRARSGRAAGVVHADLPGDARPAV